MTHPLQILAVSPGTGFQAQAWAPILGSGVNAFLLREPDLDAKDLLVAARWCQERFPEVRLWVKGRLDVALAVGCGLHAPEAYPELPSGLIPLSRPLHSENQWPERMEAQQLLVAPVFPVPGKGEPWGAARFHRFLDGLPQQAPMIFALGGITPERLPELRHPRLAGVALIRALWEAEDPGALVGQLKAAWTR